MSSKNSMRQKDTDHMKKRLLSLTLTLWLTVMTILPANVTLASTVGNGLQLQTQDVQCEIKLPKPGVPVVPCAKPNDVSWNS